MNATEISIGDDGNGVVADHAVRLIASEFPDRQHMLWVGFVIINKGVDKVDGTLTLDEAKQRMQATESVPQREHGIDGSIGMIDIQVMGAVAAIGIGEEVGGDHGMIEASIEHPFIRFVAALNLNPLQLFVPLVERLVGEGIKVKVAVGKFRTEVVFCAFYVDGGDGDTHHERLLVGIEADHAVVMLIIGEDRERS